jgi:YD repeat-containing protein
MKRTLGLVLALVAMMAATEVSVGQVPTGTHPLGSYGGGPFDTVDLGNLDVHFVIPILHKAGRGVPFAYDLSYDNTVWYPVGTSGSQTWTAANNWGWQMLGPVFAPYISYSQTIANPQQCGSMGQYTFQVVTNTNFVYHDPSGASHAFGGTYVTFLGGGPGCPSGQSPSTIAPTAALDSSGYVINLTLPGSLTAANGTNISVPWLTGPPGSTSPITTTDRNGNKITETSAVYTDTLGTTALSATGAPPSSTLFTYTAPSGATPSYTVSYHTYNVLTAFGCSGITEYNQTGKSFVDRVTLPDGSFYQFTYETTSSGSTTISGRLASVTLPTGGTITYTYSGGSTGTNHINCSDGTTVTLTRTLSPGGTWTYARTQVSGAHWQTLVTDPTTSANQTVIDFSQDTNTDPTVTLKNFYETQRLTYQGSATGTPLSTNIYCYNTASPTPSTCFSASVATPIGRRTAFIYLPNAAGLQAETDTQYFSGTAFPSQVDSYDYGSGAVGSLLRSVVSSYSIFGSDVLPTSVVVKDGAGTTKASTTYSYDQVAVTTTTGTPNHTSVTGARGNLTQIATQVSGTGTLYRRFTYYDTGTMNTSTDAGTTSSGGPNTTTYNYASGSSCGNSFVTSISEPLSLSRSMTYDSTCAGGVLESVTDENSKTASIAYTDPTFWRPASSSDQLSNATSFTYPTVNAVESAMSFNSGASVVDHRTTLDGFGRTITNQTLQGPGAGNYDSSETDYDVRGAFVKGTQPYSAASGTLCTGTCPGTSVTYDALGRTLTATDAGGGTSTISYTKNDTLQTLGPAPTGENTKRKQFEYDGLGRLSSVCEITSGTGSGTCGQTVTQTGYWTKYTYDTLGNLTGVTQNAQATSQTRTYVFDMTGRLTSETNPESGTTTYAYDALSSDPSCGTVTSAGDLLKKVDAVGNVTCFAYDALHRATSVTYPTGTYSGSTPTKKFVYDSATVNSIAMSNAKTRLAEAYTCTGTCTTKITDLGFSYSARGEVTDVLESTPNSGGYYHVTNAYWANGALKTLSGIPGVPTLTYAADGEGRVNGVSAASGQNPVTATSYNTASQVTGVTFGSSDNDSYTFDPNTGRMTQYKFNVGSGSGSTPTLVQHTNKDAGTTTSSTLAFVSNNTAGNWIGVCVRAGASGEAFTISDSKGNTYHQAFSINDTVGGNTLAIYYAENIGSGANTVTVADSISGTLRFAILEYSGVATSSSLERTRFRQPPGQPRQVRRSGHPIPGQPVWRRSKLPVPGRNR